MVTGVKTATELRVFRRRWDQGRSNADGVEDGNRAESLTTVTRSETEDVEMTTLDVIRETLADNLGIEPAEVVPEAKLDSLGIDSLDMVELICDVEERLGIEFGEPEGIDTVGKMVAYIDSL